MRARSPTTWPASAGDARASSPVGATPRPTWIGERGFLSRLAELGIGLLGRAEGGDYTFAAGHAAALALAPLRPDAIFFANDVMALGGIDAIRYRLGLRIPEDIAVVGFDDIPMSAWPGYDLTTLRQPIDRMIDETVSLVSQGKGREPPGPPRRRPASFSPAN